MRGEWIEKFKEGFDKYIDGEWKDSIQILKEVKERKGAEDGPSTTLILYMQEQGGEAPHDWPGYRELTEK